MMPKHALIVDDSQLAQFVLKKMLQEEAITAECSGSAEEALEYLKINKPDIIFLDHTMPGMNGLEVLKLLKKDTETRDIPVMMTYSNKLFTTPKKHLNTKHGNSALNTPLKNIEKLQTRKYNNSTNVLIV